MRRRYAGRRPVAKRARVGAPNSIGSNIGGMLGAATGIPGAGAVGGWLGGHAQTLLGSLWGSGDYVVRTNSLITDGKPNSPGAEGDRVRVRKAEYLGPLTVSVGTAFAPTAYILNPGNSTTFPWLSTVAQCYEEWIPHGVLFRFKSTASTNSTSTNLGSVAMATEYDVYDSAPAGKVAMLQMSASTTSSVSNDLVFGVECDPRFNPMGIFFIIPPSGVMQGSNREYILGTNYVVANEAAVAGVVGELWIEYDITLQKAQFAQGLQAQVDRWYNETAVNCYSNANPFNNGGILVHTTTSTFSDSNLTGTTYFFSPTKAVPGDYWAVVIIWVGSGAAAACTYPAITYTGCTGVLPPEVRSQGAGANSLWDGTTGVPSVNSVPMIGTAITSNTLIQTIYVFINAQNASIALSGAALPAGPAVNMRLTAYKCN